MGTRTYLGEHKEPGARFGKKKFGETTWITFKELKARADAFGAALVSPAVGMKPVPRGANLEQLEGPHTLLLFEDTCAEWMTCALGALSQSLVVATSYATLGIDAVAEAINESGVPVVVTNRKKVGDVCSLKSKCASLAHVIYTEFQTDPSVLGTPVAGANGVKALALADAFAIGDQRVHLPRAEPSPEQVAVIMYTSGSTGKPKGVLLKHESVLSSIGGLLEVLGRTAKPGDCYLGYLPQAHILEFCAELTCLAMGMHVGYADPRSLTSTGAVRERPDGSLNKAAGYPYPPGAIQEFKPTFMAGRRRRAEFPAALFRAPPRVATPPRRRRYAAAPPPLRRRDAAAPPRIVRLDVSSSPYRRRAQGLGHPEEGHGGQSRGDVARQEVRVSGTTAERRSCPSVVVYVQEDDACRPTLQERAATVLARPRDGSAPAGRVRGPRARAPAAPRGASPESAGLQEARQDAGREPQGFRETAPKSSSLRVRGLSTTRGRGAAATPPPLGTISGGGAISSEVQTFVRTAFVAPAVQGYALTETRGSGADARWPRAPPRPFARRPRRRREPVSADYLRRISASS